ncbi:N,N-dimethylformamidase beta subunit family domain-containing protein [Phytohabitans houttuyneae]|uniref:N,N-dimethylformamidase beta subunit-like C-terminal domain-containing protein n=1 Tax=Phytohabitans houttuyneae TaxID=1076126 RepID=A0A6V8KFH8_9ACTN|nr:N,N-dimethylformamidase beta subunit family domain-containing protein [Phytohabitans houttuyneae]GFJ79485.1 hypothetical protein Phou_036650 [Phytohabitans houttuyneae]
MSVISDENALTGTPKATWDVTGAGDTSIQGFPRRMSVNQGDTLQFSVHSPDSAWAGTVYRLGWYSGDGGRDIDDVSGPQTAQPAGTTNATTGMVDCGNWLTNGSWAVPADACPGVYVIKIWRTDNTALASHIGPFVVRDPSRKAPLAVKTSDSTWQAYNHAGADPDDILNGKSIYGTGTSSAFTFSQATRSRAVSYHRPLVTRQHLPQTSFWNAEYPLVRWLERCGYDLDYVSCVDVDTNPDLLLDREAVVSSGHDEYWSPGMRDAHIEARDAGVNQLYLSGNEAFWRINYNADRRQYACWKDTHDGALNPTGVYSGTWQDTRGFNPDRRPAALLNGQRFRLNGLSAYELVATADHAGSPFWRDTAVAALSGASTWTSPDHIIGFEGDEPADMDPGETPSGLLRLSEVTYTVANLIADDDGNIYTGSGDYTHALTLYRAQSGAMVFGAGTVQYAWGLDDIHDRHPGGTLATTVLQQALTNLLADMGVPPETLPAGLVEPVPVDSTAYGFTEDPMANAAFNKFKEGLLGGLYDLNTATIKAALVRGYTFDPTDEFVADVVATGTINGTSAALANPTLTDGVFDADDTSIATTANATNHGLLVFQSSAVTGGADVAQSAQRLIAYYDTGTGLPIQPGTGTVAVGWSGGTNRILKVG